MPTALDETLAEVQHILECSLAFDQRLALAIARARGSDDELIKNLALDLYLLRADRGVSVGIVERMVRNDLPAAGAVRFRHSDLLVDPLGT